MTIHHGNHLHPIPVVFTAMKHTLEMFFLPQEKQHQSEYSLFRPLSYNQLHYKDNRFMHDYFMAAPKN